MSSGGSDSPASAADKRTRVVARFSYLPANDDELELKVDDVIEVLSVSEEGWLKGQLNGKIGLFAIAAISSTHLAPIHFKAYLLYSRCISRKFRY